MFSEGIEWAQCHEIGWRQYNFSVHVQKQRSRFVQIKRCSENMQQIYRRTPMLKYDFNKVKSNYSLSVLL